MRVAVKYFGQMAEIAGTQEDQLELNEGASTADVIDAIHQKHQAASGIALRIAVNMKLVESDTKIQMDQEIAVLPPFAGG